tara:strand:+ start:6327 stop:7742 length:1416 start_codon:yes stop_codon:yes gene_type:complete
MATDKSNAIVRQLATVLENEARSGMNYTFDGDQFIFPGHVSSLKEAGDICYDMHHELEEEVSNRHQFTGHPNELLYAFYKACNDTFGKMTGKSTSSFFGSQPAESRNIDIAFGERITVPYGNVEVPGLPIEMHVEVYEHTNRWESILTFSTTCRRKFESLVKRIIAEVERIMNTESIFKGKAIDSEFSFLDVNGFDLDSVIYGVEEYAQLRANVFRFIEDTDYIKNDLGMGLNRKILLYGSYGTGKSLTARRIAHMCSVNGWTYMQAADDDFHTVLNFAQQKKLWPMVIFKEDVDTDTGSDRDVKMNRILNQLDGALTKDAQVITVLTTNHIEEIQAAMNRPGRTDAQLEIGHVDEDVLERIVRYHCRKVEIDDSIDFGSLLKAAESYTPAFVVEGCKRAMLYTEKGESIDEEALRRALESLRAQFDRMMVEPEPDTDSITKSIEAITRKDRETLHDDISSLADMVEDLKY